jgi:hypothetical protein
LREWILTAPESAPIMNRLVAIDVRLPALIPYLQFGEFDAMNMKSSHRAACWMIGAAMAAALLISPVGNSHAGVAIATVTPAPSASGAGVVVGIATALATYDFVRRISCAGDFFRLGGPGFDRPIKPVDNVLTLRCVR